MADNFLERQRRDYDEHKDQWQRSKGHLSLVKRCLEKPEDEAL